MRAPKGPALSRARPDPCWSQSNARPVRGPFRRDVVGGQTYKEKTSAESSSDLWCCMRMVRGLRTTAPLRQSYPSVGMSK